MHPLARATLIVIVLTLLPLGIATAAGPYPSPTPDFAHPGSPHDGLYSPTGGNRDRPMLVIYMQFSDVPYRAGLDAAFMANRFFGPYPSVANYFSNDSFGRLILSPAAESDASNNGTANDGVVSVSIASTKAAFLMLGETDRTKQALQAADPAVNYAAFDTNGNGALSDDELVVQYLAAAPGPIGPGCGATRGVSAVSLDGKSLGGLSVSMDDSDTNLMTIIHETAHVAIHMRDLYGFGVGALDISGPTCGASDTLLMRTSAWQKTHVGWITPTVVTRDGYYNVSRADSSGAAFILYDPDRGTNDYFIVENRQRTAGTYDQSASDSGLVIWRIDETQYNSGDESKRPIDIMRPDGTTNGGCPAGCYSGSNGDAWDPADGTTPQRTMNRSWRDATAAKVAVRAIGPSGAAIRAYFDVRGPGILVDPTNPNGTPKQIDVTPEEANPVSFTVMNTGETTDTFNFTVGNLPAGWTATTDTQTLGAGMGSVANVLVTVPADAAVGPYPVTAVGVSTSDATIRTEVEFTLRVVLHQTSITYTGATSVPYGEPAGFRAQVTDITDTTDIVAGAAITFQLTNGVDTQTVVATTDSTGVAQAGPTLTVPPGNYTLTVSMPRFGKHAGASTSRPYTVERRPTTLVYSGVLTAEYSDPAMLSATLTDTLSGSPLASRTITFALGPQSASALTGLDGVASAQLILDQPAGTLPVTADYAGDTYYLPSSDADPFTVDREDLTFVYTGDTLAGLGTPPTLAGQATQEADGFPGDLSRAEANFHLAPTLTTLPFDYLAALDAGGYGSATAADLPVDLWTVTVAVPASNLYWEGAAAAPVELVLYDPDGSIAGGGHGSDAGAAEVQLTLTGRYHGSLPRGQIQFRSSMGRFKGESFDWIVVVGNQAILQVHDGSLTLRLRLQDAGEPGVGADTFTATLTAPDASVLYTSGPVLLEGGNLQVLKP